MFQGLELNFYEFLPYLRAEIYQIQNSRILKMAKIAVLELLDSPKLITRKIGL